MTLDPAGPVRQALYATDISDLSTAKVVVRGDLCVVGGASQLLYYAVPPGSVTGAVAGIGVDWANITNSVADATTTSKGIVQLSGDIGGTATSVSVLKVNGTSITPGGTLLAGKVIVATGASSADWRFITDTSVAAGAGISWGKLAGYPTVYATAPLTIDGGASANISTDRTIAISSASGGSAGSMSAADFTKLASISGTQNKITRFGASNSVIDSYVWSLANIDGVSITFLQNTGEVLIGRNRGSGSGETDFIANRGAGAVGGFAWYDMPNVGTETFLAKLNGDGFSLPTRAIFQDTSLLASAAASFESLQAVTGQIIARAGGGYIDYAITPVNPSASSTAAPKIQKISEQFQVTAPTSTTYTISTSIFGQAMPANRELYGILLVTQRVDSVATTGYAGMYLISGQSNGSGLMPVSSVNIVPLGIVGPGSAVPTVSVAASGAANFTITINNGSEPAGSLTGLFNLELGWCGT